MTHITITDVFLRDGLQDQDVILSAEQRIEIGQEIAAAGIQKMEVAAFVNPNRVPQMQGAEEVYQGLSSNTQADLSALVLNGKGLERASNAGLKTVQLVVSASEAHSRENAGNSIKDALSGLKSQVEAHPEMSFIGGISTAFTCPFEGEIPVERVLEIVGAYQEMGIGVVGIADTLGNASTERVSAVLKQIRQIYPGIEISMHLHNALGQALDTVTAAVELGVTRFDSALGGFGGCPFAPGAAGNLATEDLVAHLHSLGHTTNVDIEKLSTAARNARAVMGASASANPIP